jgi:hypothetical protein
MMLTREQAAATWCPMVRIARHEVIEERRSAGSGMEIVSQENHVVGGCNSASGIGCGPRNPASSRCIADKCAMWRWGETDVRSERKIEEVGALRREVTESITVPTRGYCGLAGRPEL